MKFLVITGISGAGKSHAVKYIEDLGFFCVDNLPPSLIPKFAEICLQSGGKIDKVALVIDIRGKELLKDFFPSFDAIKEAGVSCEILFLDASDEVLIKRFKESRRAHPLAHEGRLVKSINEERKILDNIKRSANYYLDTSNLKSKQLKEELHKLLLRGKEYDGMIINLISFGFKYGIPIDCDLVFDVRFIPNPYYIESMKRLSGKDEFVKDYVLFSEETKEFINKLMDMLDFLIPNYKKEGKSQLVIAIGCTGGRHRSVAISDKVFKLLEEREHSVIIDHRDIEEDGRCAKI